MHLHFNIQIGILRHVKELLNAYLHFFNARQLQFISSTTPLESLIVLHKTYCICKVFHNALTWFKGNLAYIKDASIKGHHFHEKTCFLGKDRSSGLSITSLLNCYISLFGEVCFYCQTQVFLSKCLHRILLLPRLFSFHYFVYYFLKRWPPSGTLSEIVAVIQRKVKFKLTQGFTDLKWSTVFKQGMLLEPKFSQKDLSLPGFSDDAIFFKTLALPMSHVWWLLFTSRKDFNLQVPARHTGALQLCVKSL